ncbi:MAG: ferrous iron transport protein A [Clostridia bacterium]|nr:ferrous iron transport protein A [Clostridia bacterium]
MRHRKEREAKIIASAADMRPGEKGVVTSLEQKGRGIENRLRDLGMTEGCVVECVGISPLGDPAAYRIRGAVIALRKRDAVCVAVAGDRV